jgi:hypothetical protein
MGMPCLNIKVTTILEQSSDSNIRANKPKNGSPWYDDPDDEDTMILPNVCKYSSLDTV